ncbi:MAG: hypothetical protein KAI24_17595, partial [Planctomycetes bacterium]|nr:hypothetical protein [Planctomycetota bacterium]
TGAGNVDVRQINPWTTRDYDPEAVDAIEGWVEITTKTLGRFQVIAAASPAAPQDYMPPIGAVVDFPGGWRFEVEEEPAGSVYAGLNAEQWTITGPAFDERLIVVDDRIVGRRREPQVWLESWSEPYDPFRDPTVAIDGLSTQPAQVSAPISQQFIGATIMPLGYFQFALPRSYDGELLTDVGKLTINVAYVRSDLGTGERRLAFWLSPDRGVLQMSVDGVVYERIP